MAAPSTEKVRVSVLVPTRNEASNVAPLVERLERALAAVDGGGEVVFVDDSDDDTPEQVRRVAATAKLPVTLLARAPGERDGGLGGAVIAGARCAGASTAMLLARQGLRVLVVDPLARGTDTLSTHALMRAGVLQLHRWGLLDEVRAAGTPPIRSTTRH